MLNFHRIDDARKTSAQAAQLGRPSGTVCMADSKDDRLTATQRQTARRISSINRRTTSHLSGKLPALKFDDMNAFGRYLMRHGVNLPGSFPDRMRLLEGTRP